MRICEKKKKEKKTEPQKPPAVEMKWGTPRGSAGAATSVSERARAVARAAKARRGCGAAVLRERPQALGRHGAQRNEREQRQTCVGHRAGFANTARSLLRKFWPFPGFRATWWHAAARRWGIIVYP